MRDQDTVDALIRQHLYLFVRKVFATVVPGVPFLNNWHIQALAYQLERCSHGEVKRLLITLPPRHLKSLTASVAFVAWMLGHDPTRRIVCASYGQELSEKHALDTRIVMQSDWFKRVFPKCRLHRQKNTMAELMTTAQGYRFATSVGGSLTGRGGNIFIIDDPHKAQEVESDAQRQGVIDWHRSTLLSRRDNPEDDVIIVIQQRLHEEDLAGYLLANGEWVHLNLPAIAEHEEAIAVGAGEVHLRRSGELLHPERLPQRILDELREDMGSHRFAAQYQQNPVPLGGGIVKWRWFRFYERPPMRPIDGMLVQSWDTATKGSAANDYSVCTTWLMVKNHCYLLDLYRAHLDYPQLKAQIIEQAGLWRADAVLIEDVGAGSALCQDLQADAPRFSVIPTRPQGDKVSRLMPVCALIEAGKILLPREAPWLADFQREITLFPKGRYDDQVDSLSQFLEYFRGRQNELRESEAVVRQIKEYTQRAQGSRAHQLYRWCEQHSHRLYQGEYFNFSN